jgi:hypothetical protein
MSSAGSSRLSGLPCLVCSGVPANPAGLQGGKAIGERKKLRKIGDQREEEFESRPRGLSQTWQEHAEEETYAHRLPTKTFPPAAAHTHTHARARSHRCAQIRSRSRELMRSSGLRLGRVLARAHTKCSRFLGAYGRAYDAAFGETMPCGRPFRMEYRIA